MTIRFRPANPDDAAGIAEVHVASWRTTYRGIFPDEVLADLSVSRREASWLESIRREANFIFTALDGDRIVGFSCGGPEREGIVRQLDGRSFDGELYAIYILEAYQGQGVGTRLFEMLVERLLMAGFERMLVWVVTDNGIGNRFYEAKGGVLATRRMITIVGVDVEETGYGWDLPISS